MVFANGQEAKGSMARLRAPTQTVPGLGLRLGARRWRAGFPIVGLGDGADQELERDVFVNGALRDISSVSPFVRRSRRPAGPSPKQSPPPLG